MANYTQSATHLYKVCMRFRNEKKEDIFSINLSNNDYERKAVCTYINQTEFLKTGETGGYILNLTLYNEEEFKRYIFYADKKEEVKQLVSITNGFLTTGILPIL